VTRELALSFGLKAPSGALVVDVIDGGPAVGVLKQGDIILEFDGKAIKDSSALPVIVGSTELGVDVNIKISRAGKTEILKIVLSELPSEDQVKAEPKKEEPKEKTMLLGMELADLDDATKKTLDVQKGVLVKGVEGDPAKTFHRCET